MSAQVREAVKKSERLRSAPDDETDRTLPGGIRAYHEPAGAELCWDPNMYIRKEVRYDIYASYKAGYETLL